MTTWEELIKAVQDVAESDPEVVATVWRMMDEARLRRPVAATSPESDEPAALAVPVPTRHGAHRAA